MTVQQRFYSVTCVITMPVPKRSVNSTSNKPSIKPIYLFLSKVWFLPPATKLREGNSFTPVCDSVHRGVSVQGGVSAQGGSLSKGEGSLSKGEGSLSKGEGSLSKGDLCPGALCPRGVSVQGGGVSVQGVSVQGGSLFRGQRGLCPGGSLSGRPLYGNVRAVRTLLECILVYILA